MNIAIVGYGKMGKTIEQIAKDRGRNIALVIDQTPTSEELKKQKIDVAIEFSTPETAFQNLKVLMDNGIPTVSGTTGWLDKRSEIEKSCIENGAAFLYASNFSLGVNIFFALNQFLAKTMKNYDDQYKVLIEEIHHTQKLDAPSGTAISLAQGIIENSNYSDWALTDSSTSEKSIPITAVREDPAPGTHTIEYHSEIDSIEIKHTAHSRKGFALGAVLAAEFLSGKKGMYSMQDVLNLPV